MRIVILFAVLGLSIVVGSATAQSHHNPVYLVGGFWMPGKDPSAPLGLFLYDRTGSTPTLAKLCDTPFSMLGPMDMSGHNAIMDADNRSLIGLTGGPVSTFPAANCFLRYDARTSTWSTLAKFPRSVVHPSGFSEESGFAPMIDQNGDYLFPYQRREVRTSPTTLYLYESRILKFDHMTHAVSTLLLTTQLPAKYAAWFHGLGKDIDSGKLLIGGGQTWTSPTTLTRYPVWTLNPEDGYNPANVGYWNDGSVYGWPWAMDSFEQNVKNGCMEGKNWDSRFVYRLKPGTSGMTTITTLTGFPPCIEVRGGHRFDSQSASRPRFLSVGYYPYTIFPATGPWFIAHDVNTWSITKVDHVLKGTKLVLPNVVWQDFYRGRHIQTVRTAPNKWDIRLSVPQYPGQAYALVGGVSGVRPGVALPDGRNINLNPDAICVATLSNLLKPVFDPGPLKLDARWGEAKGELDLSTLPIPKTGLGIPFWIAMAVIDPHAPCGIAYLPDTYVMRL